MGNLPKKTLVRRSENQIACDLGGETVLLNLQNGVYYGLNPSGALIWNFLEKPKTAGEIMQTLSAKYDVDPEACERDVCALLKDLEKNGLVQIRDERPR